MDEATSHLDVVTESRVERNLSTLSCTRIVIAHRLSTICDADQILVLEDGLLAERGTYKELIARDGCYAALVSGQLGLAAEPV
jgi:ABC-type multidrug transport system fused ATPase/permease subunit